ncbi:MGH1-like glycoside hydrolase domain-containing protein [Streptomyces sp. NPDC001393]
MDRSSTQLTVRPAEPAKPSPYETAGGPPVSGTPLHLRAAQVLDANWTGGSTVPSRSLYPHQWSWDSAFIAIGLRHVSPLRAQTELETLLAAQWADGRVPHIVFNPSVPLDAYFPSPDFWRSSTAGRRAGAPRTVQTSGIVQPPVHALAAWLVHLADPGLSHARGFLARVYPRLAAWHRYLLHRRDLGGAGLVSVVHPWEQGMDNSPCWDAPLARITPAPARSFRRADLAHGAPEDRPTDLDYGRYVRLAADYRDAGYADGSGEFAVEDPAFNALLIASEHALARIAEELGAAGTARHTRAERLTQVLVDRLWDPAYGMFLCRDLRDAALGGRQIHERAASGPGRERGSSGPDRERGTADPNRERGSSGPVPERSTADPNRERGGSGPVPERSTADPTPEQAGPGLIPERGVSGLVPLILPELPREIAAALVRTLCGPHFGLGGRTRLVPSYDLLGEAFDPHRYWRGPAWFNTSWLLERGLRAHGERERADALRAAVLELAEATGFAEYVDPYTGEACGATGFGWTAALALDLHHELHEELHDGLHKGLHKELSKPPGHTVSPTGGGTFDRSDEGGHRR